MRYLLETCMIAIFLFIIWYVIILPERQLEPFILPGSPIHKTIHVRLNKYGQKAEWDYQPPAANGEYGCTQTRCPEPHTDMNVICWACCNYH